jgi:hypothetical protein
MLSPGVLIPTLFRNFELIMTTATITRPKTTNGFTAADNSVRVAVPLYGSIISKHLAKRILNHLRSKVGAGAGEVPPAGHLQVVHATINQAQLDLEQRIGMNLHILRTYLMGGGREGLNLDVLLRVQRECDFVFIDRNTINTALQNSLNHYLGHAGYTEAEFNKLKLSEVFDEEECS